MKQSLKLTDIIAVGFMLFAFFLGAGNIIFPPIAGQMAGEHVYSAMGGFLITAVGLPLLTIIAIGIAGGSWQQLTRDLPPKVAMIMAILMFVIIGPAFAAPRTGLVAYEMAAKPFMSAEAGQLSLTLFSIAFFSIAMFFAWSQGKLIDTIGKFLTPALFIGLIILAIAVFVNPQGDIVAATGNYIEQPLTTGFFEGYNTMDTFGALMFGILIIDALKKKGITEHKATTKYLTAAGCIAALGLAFVYVSLFYLGATSSAVAPGAANGGAILTAYTHALFGSSGQIVLSVIVLIACLTTAIGLISACADYFSSICKVTYKTWVIVVGVACAVVANVGLTQLIALSVPVLFLLYPVAIALVALAFVRKMMPNPRLAYRVVILVATCFAVLDAAKVAGADMSAFSMLPLFNHGMAWVIPTFVSMIAVRFVGKKEDELVTENA
ncbi:MULTISPECIES: branched-chain amino acid transport system II carrier protein [Aliivibrio]|uniref:Branched-chain amino acid transport system carrier protein n=1 Tax=Aliivibrio finisterrensis TaxID=511998 RepID=A0A4Q5KZM7_9GAMM|nr:MULTISPECIES: branched-chain amino acid transport system II carrier protein [Aliivibrio]MDD9177478.1 branched-chain amino acid transport system II carrier protein [Aliivibrio sp. A6]RYU54091.1 branched-chain amino acid transport system II carrier protein [Aliivibrio finisterrensis]RYU56135.1 branched-chain amino acid transport system II carrier protein [Aliivibrio finisterrensis]RYU61052.1 branched-chain amino acid transport system II carrier protein [Aliivibrio finisterrensis]RYU67158.1 br